jgi:hypothetical protein
MLTPEQKTKVKEWQDALLKAQSDGEYTAMSILIIRLDTLNQLGMI